MRSCLQGVPGGFQRIERVWCITVPLEGKRAGLFLIGRAQHTLDGRWSYQIYIESRADADLSTACPDEASTYCEHGEINGLCRLYDEVGAYIDLPSWEVHSRWRLRRFGHG